jgi:hypothetical protein
MNDVVRQVAGDCAGQASTEFMLVGLLLVSALLAVSTLAGHMEDGVFVEHASQSASHALSSNTAGTAGDVLLY